jgi:hypothetical protein
MGVKASLVEQSATLQPIKISLPHVLFPPLFATCFNHKVFYSSSHGNASRVPSGVTEPPEAPINFLSGPLFFSKISCGGGEKKFSNHIS